MLIEVRAVVRAKESQRSSSFTSTSRDGETHVKSLVKKSLTAFCLICSFKYLALRSTRLASNPVFLHLAVSSSKILST